MKEIGKTNFTIGRRRESVVTYTVEIDTTVFEGAIAAFIRSAKVEIEDTAALKLGKSNVIRKTSGLCGHRNQSN
jgi:hypothetical protein